VLTESQRAKVPAIDKALASVIADGLFLPTTQLPDAIRKPAAVTQ
jgi:hypothetical protein